MEGIPNSVLDQIRGIVGEENVITDAQECVFIAQDVYSQGAPAGAWVKPGDKQQLAEMVGVAASAGIALVARGGGMSYTGGYVPANEHSVVVDMSRMNRVLEINQQDMYVTVEAGITWQDLNEAMQGTGLRTPYWGTLSGRFATVGGGLSQNSIFWGSGRYGSAVDSVISMEVVLADGSILSTGSASQINSTPFYRHYGPDLTGLFCGDCGALGFKATATFKLIPELPVQAFGSFAFETYEEMVPAMSEIARGDLATEVFGFDPYLQSQRMKRESLSSDAKNFVGALKSAGGVGQAIKQGAKMAVAGRRFMDDVKWSFHVMMESRTDASAQACLEEVRKIVAANNGRELADSIPRLVRANPFGPVNNMLGPEGERWVPVHGLVPHSKASDTMQKVEALFASHRERMKELEIETGYLVATVSTHCFVIEPVFFWPDEVMEIHRRYVEPDHLKKIKGFDQNLEAREMVAKIKGELVELLKDVGAVHLQIAKTYRYREGLHPESWSLVESLKNVLDPDNRINPGTLGFSA
jgi:FAD/FMN-containing dehydrogenase